MLRLDLSLELSLLVSGPATEKLEEVADKSTRFFSIHFCIILIYFSPRSQRGPSKYALSFDPEPVQILSMHSLGV